MRVLWLASWYPNPYEPYNGDFIQRHARGVAEIIPVDVIHVLQNGADSKKETTVKTSSGLTEYFYAFNFKKWGIGWMDKIRYNILYHKCYNRVLKLYIHNAGKPDLVHVHVPVKAGIRALYLLRNFKIPYIVSEQSSHYETASPGYFFKRSIYYQNNCRRIFAKAAAVTNVSATIGKTLQEIFSIKKYTTIHNLVDTDIFNYKNKTVTGKLKLIHVSALGEQKNPAGIINALFLLKQMNQNWECIICGPHNAALKGLMEKYELNDHIKFTGEVPHNEVASYMQESDLFILFSNHENFPCVIIEALCCGLPVVSSVAGGIAEAVNENNGLLVTAGDEVQLAGAINTMINKIEFYKRDEIAADAKNLYDEVYISNSFVKLYDEILGDRHSE